MAMEDASTCRVSRRDATDRPRTPRCRTEHRERRTTSVAARALSYSELEAAKRAESPGNQAVLRRARSRKLEFQSWFSLELCVRLGSQRAKSRAKCSIYDAFFPVSALPLAYLCRV